MQLKLIKHFRVLNISFLIKITKLKSHVFIPYLDFNIFISLLFSLLVKM